MTDWDTKLIDVLWPYRIAYKITTKFTHFQLVYGQEGILPIELKILSLRIVINEGFGETESLEARINLLKMLDEIESQANLNTTAI